MRKWAFLIALLVTGLAISGYSYFKAQKLQTSIDNRFKHELSSVLSNLSLTMNDDTYRSVLSSVSNAASISDLTSYEEQNDSLDISLEYLYISLREDKSKDKVLSRADELRDIFLVIMTDPASKEATDKILKITEETFLRNGWEGMKLRC
ncbi:hypothetical protein [Paenibacillus mucilaginosus]|uniref:hypothetical protein n=1 Tax=Paenibacillus mucilaginosus TaxID=61624 RepID=UPI0005A27A72|nr:hypothetical protein [Paenibacillus mucilaginosus]MCG7214377.1 hypothetical protein [Paenibacillus mucilaginosus]WDM30663.1 hypothetical protein KCX80_16560 [Paenibacillus mucilaginosus]